jgi:hypothetical protein
MGDERDLRLRGGRVLARMLGSHEHREMFADNGYTNGQQIVLALADDLVVDVFDRVRQYPSPVTVAIFWPETERLTFSTFEAAGWAGDDETFDVGSTVTIGMLWDSAQQEGPRVRFRTEKQLVSAAPFVMV